MSGHDLDSDAAASPARRGRPARINREQIVTAALGIAPEPLTMQAVADALGVDRKSVKYHIGDRETLLALMASAVFEVEFERVPPPLDGDWRDVLRWYARRARNAITELGVHDAFPMEGAIGLAALGQAEFVLETLVDAGFAVEQAGRAANTVAELALSAARDALLRADRGIHPQHEEAMAAIDIGDQNAYTVLRQVLTAMAAEADEHAQLEFNLDVVIAGLTTMLQQRAG
ncbi:TetR/AcrR family transcriptional regulator C-terminal domain-containing protein [Mycolicibacterium setense]|uniref:TetR/AcrR family transcriptional regulator C-terminal domain-containing protein n=1 Tax=Mycolicibacterium setense TaxID=431269 RepID=UPI00069111F9|nr:TetR/AcrR family transcriptional regulator C-terminal domain-containing protein [Mycolicibacterium setense]MCV7113435.1 TetR/AcrR family transcriptional regulator C-terminal domain-containing protein [Mycolicibacterium setense]